MKVVLFCGGQGLRIRDSSNGGVPKPMIAIGSRPIIWHVMRYYAHYGHRDFILCLGYRGEVIENYFRHRDEATSNDFVLTEDGHNIEMSRTDMNDWDITCVDTGLSSSVGERLMAVRSHLEGEEVFLANYADGVSDLDLNSYLGAFTAAGKTGSFVAIPPNASFHVVQFREDGLVQRVRHIGQSDVRINGGFFAFRQRVFEYLRPGEDLVAEPFQRMIDDEELIAYPHQGFWACMDTLKEKQALEDMYASGRAPWEVWKAK